MAQFPPLPVHPGAPAAPDPGPALSTHGLTRDYGRGTGVFDVGLVVPRGSVYGLVGPNGAGKTTLLSLISGMRRADAGEVLFGVPLDRIAVCTDVPEFEPWLSAAEVVELAGRLVNPDLRPECVKTALHRAGLSDAADRRAGSFSRGMTQRLGIATALVAEPELMILDEPTSALDPRGRAEVLDLVAGMRGRTTVVFSSHILADVQRVCDHVGVLRTGRLLYEGPVAELVAEHMRPTWLIRVRDDGAALCRTFAAENWVVRVSSVRPGLVRVQARSVEEGERHILGVLDRSGERVISVGPEESDLESAFLSITGAA
ncbi:ABC transporter ATP-binding protein [Yinghuangia seranimata]|uniref:ABC transporter ATP-binding protein n=1 Tax=Yinghuangia seranimata TaxID=408067 RepID=UPI00248D125B|nr:ABC transporter ATP-binding protein [Yinghuangia seranimata]MDI2131227.1 ABC transporter ATP-binding protein [Yinghuangia seranimata]